MELYTGFNTASHFWRQATIREVFYEKRFSGDLAYTFYKLCSI